MADCTTMRLASSVTIILLLLVASQGMQLSILNFSVSHAFGFVSVTIILILMQL
jgi:hypothetical protein